MEPAVPGCRAVGVDRDHGGRARLLWPPLFRGRRRTARPRCRRGGSGRRGRRPPRTPVAPRGWRRRTRTRARDSRRRWRCRWSCTPSCPRGRREPGLLIAAEVRRSCGRCGPDRAPPPVRARGSVGTGTAGSGERRSPATGEPARQAGRTWGRVADVTADAAAVACAPPACPGTGPVPAQAVNDSAVTQNPADQRPGGAGPEAADQGRTSRVRTELPPLSRLHWEPEPAC